MANDIGVGDLVMVVRARACGCGHAADPIGLPFTVRFSQPAPLDGKCNDCNATTFRVGTMIVSGPRNGWWCEHSRLQKINPPATATEAQTVRYWHEKKHYPTPA